MGEGSTFCQELRAPDSVTSFYFKDRNNRPHKVSFSPCDKMSCPKLCFGKNMQKENTCLTTIPVFRGKTHTKYITQDPLG